MALRLYNTLSGKIEDFHPLDGNRVRMYACGPTVYDYGHIGNFRTFIAVDLLYRYLRQSGYDVRYVMNITDVDDKIIRNSARDGVNVQQYTAKFAQAFLEDSATLNIDRPILVRATEHINAMANFIAELVKKGFAYRTDDGSYYFRIAKFPEYGKLSSDFDDTSARWMQAFFVLADAINRAGSTAPDKIQAALKATDLKPDQLMIGYNGVKFDDTGQNTLSATYLIQLQGKQYVSVWPENRATATLQWPMKGWH